MGQVYQATDTKLDIRRCGKRTQQPASPAEIEVYGEVGHGWCVLDSRVHYDAEADRAWAQLLRFFESALA